MLQQEFVTTEKDFEALPLPIQADKVERYEYYLKFLYQLQLSLDPNVLLKNFFTTVQTDMDCSGMEYNEHMEESIVEFGQKGRHFFDCPLGIEDEPLGHLQLSRDEKFTDGDLSTLRDMIHLLIHPLRNSLRYQRSLHYALRDPLTGIGNRTGLIPALQREIDLSKRHGLTFSILALDLDHFKSVNDTHGHLAGDQLLKALTDEMCACIRDTDQIFRTGGEEFLILSENTDIHGAIQLGFRIRTSVENFQCEYESAVLRMTVSVGVTSFVPEDTEEGLLKRADQALYQAKKKGRNTVSEINPQITAKS